MWLTGNGAARDGHVVVMPQVVDLDVQVGEVLSTLSSRARSMDLARTYRARLWPDSGSTGRAGDGRRVADHVP